jgi:MOSC domain-containing protein YiiM
MAMRIVSLNTGRVAPLLVADTSSVSRVQSAIYKTSVSSLADPQPVVVGWLGLEGDEQADLAVHGGRDKALYAYPVEHYPVWRTIRMQALSLDEELAFGAMGENLTITGLAETDLWIGDVISFGGASPDQVIARVAAPRSPCFKFNARLGFKHAAKIMVQSGYTGFYLEVMKTGVLSAGDPLSVRPGPRLVRLDEMHRLNMRGG